MQARTYRASSMALALAEVKKDLGKDAVILRTRSHKTGAVMGMGGQTVIEIIATTHDDALVERERARFGSRGAPSSAAAEFEAMSFPTRTLAGLASPSPASSSPSMEPKPLLVRKSPDGKSGDFQGEIEAVSAPLDPVDSNTADELRQELASIRRMVEQMLETTGTSEGASPRATTDTNDDSGVEPAAAESSNEAIQTAPLRRSEPAPEPESKEPATIPAGPSDPLADLRSLLKNAGVRTRFVDDLLSRLEQRLNVQQRSDAQVVAETAVRLIAEDIPCAGNLAERAQARPRRRILALIGPTGVGKTTTIAKLAATFKLRYGLRVGLVTADTYRVAAVDQLRVYADIIGLTLKVVTSPDEMEPAITEFTDVDVVLVDTAGRSQNDAKQLRELREMLKAANPDEIHLVLAITSSEAVLRKTAERFATLKPTRLILTKLDEAVASGPILNVARLIPIPISYITTGQEVPEHIEAAEALSLARRVIEGVPDAVEAEA